MRKSKRFGALALVAGLAIAAAACGSDDKESSASTAAPTTAAGASTTAGGGSTPAGGSVDGSKVLACEVTDTGGADDKGFNQSA